MVYYGAWLRGFGVLDSGSTLAYTNMKLRKRRACHEEYLPEKASIIMVTAIMKLHSVYVPQTPKQPRWEPLHQSWWCELPGIQGVFKSRAS